MFVLLPSICGFSYCWKQWQLQEHRSVLSVTKKGTQNKRNTIWFQSHLYNMPKKKPEATLFLQTLWTDYSKTLPEHKIKSLSAAALISSPHNLEARSDVRCSSNHSEGNSYMMHLTQLITKLKATALITSHCGNQNNGTTTILQIAAGDL